MHGDQICLLVSTIHSPNQVVDEIVHKLNQLGFARPLTPENMLPVSTMLSKAKCLMNIKEMFVPKMSVKELAYKTLGLPQFECASTMWSAYDTKNKKCLSHVTNAPKGIGQA